MNLTPPPFALIDGWLKIGDITSCANGNDHTCIHIFRNDFDQICGFPKHQRDIVFDYKDGEPFNEEMFSKLDDLAGSIPKNETVLVHCHAGACRSPSVAAYLLSKVTGRDIFDCIAEVSREIWNQRGIPVNITRSYLKSVATRLGQETLLM